ncbi:hypothetical protein V6R21_05865 [Limibacter armeniacum]|uniref:hypothetical protein n=1 Tax=Limibacter armeniacum TaxID=466084 RepID=UPI002FE5C1FE
MNKERAITYSLLAHIRNKGTLVEGPIDIFKPLIKRTLSKLSKDRGQMKGNGVNVKGNSILEIKKVSDELYSIDFPIPVLRNILNEISDDINTNGITHFCIYQDNSFEIYNYEFDDYDDVINKQKKVVNNLEKLYLDFCKSEGLKNVKGGSIFKFIEKNKFNLSKYISNKEYLNGNNYTQEAKFINFFKKIPQVYEQIKDIYLGAIITSFIEYETTDIERDVELLLDTNFIVSLIDLNTPESTHTCKTLINIAKQEGFKIKVLKDTLEETKGLLTAKASNFHKSFLQKKINSEDVYNACDRKGFTKVDLERIIDNIEDIIKDLDIQIVYLTDKDKNKARFSNEFTSLKNVRNSEQAALHDSLALLYVKEKRGGLVKDFDKVNCWFVNNSASSDSGYNINKNRYQPETIKADELLNILWLSNPRVNKSIDSKDLAEIGLTSIVSFTLNKALPKAKIIRDLDENIQKYAKEKITDQDIIRISTRIVDNQLNDIEELNSISEKDQNLFVKRLEEESKKQKEIDDRRIEGIERIMKEFEGKINKTEELYKKVQRSNKESKEDKENKNKYIKELEDKIKRSEQKEKVVKLKEWEDGELMKWRRKSWINLSICILLIITSFVIIFIVCDGDTENFNELLKGIKSSVLFPLFSTLISLIFSIFILKALYDKYHNHSNIQNYLNRLDKPDYL